MNTYETMKHKIPEGATHYRDESDDFRFSWVMFDDGGALKVYTTALGWCRFNHSKFKDKVKPIPKIPTETPEEKEALDAIKQVEWDGEGLPPVGVECEIYCPVNPVSPDGDKHWAKTEIVAIIDCGFGANTTVVYKTGWSGEWYVDAHPSDLLKFRKPKTPEANKVREAVENLHDASQQAESLALRETLAHETLDKSVDEQLKTYRYEKVADTGFFELKDEFQGRMIFFNQSVTSTPDYAVAMDIIELSHHFMQKNLYRRIEVTERELFIEEVGNLANKFAEWKGLQRVDDLDMDFFSYLFESGKFNLVNGKW